MKGLLKLLFKILFKVKVVGYEKINFDKPAIIMPNHISFLDPFILYSYLPKNVTFVVNTEIASNFSFFFKFVNHVTIDPLNPYSLKKVISLMRQGNSIVIFPEGRITTTGSFMKIYGGLGLLASKGYAKVYPVIIHGLEYSKLSRITHLVNSRFFPKTTLYFDDELIFDTNLKKNFKNKKLELSNQILTVFQNAKFKTKEISEDATNLFDILLNQFCYIDKNKVMAEDISTSTTYKEAIITSYVLGNKLKSILGDETKVGVLLPNSVGHLVTLLSLFSQGITPAILNFTSGLSNNIDCSSTAELKTIITSKVFVEKGNLTEYIKNMSQNFKFIYLEDIKQSIKPFDKIQGLISYISGKKAIKTGNDSIILFTSGSESKPKGVVLSHRNLWANINQISTVIDFTHKDIMLNALPMFHSLGLTAGTFLPLLSGLKVYLYPTPLHYKIIPELVYDKNASIIIGTPSFLMGYAKNAHHYDFNTLRYAIAGGEKLKPEVRDLWLSKFGIRILEGYGTTETSPVLSVNTPLFNKKDTVGKLLPGISWKLEPVEGIEDAGNLIVKGPNIMKGYLISGKGFVPSEEWYKCGDVVNIDKEGFITIKARLKRFAKLSGEMVSLDFVETMAEKCFGPHKYASLSIPDSKKGEKIILITTNPEANRKTLREYYLQSGENTLSLPSEITIMEKLPLLGTGKVNYIELSSMIKKEN